MDSTRQVVRCHTNPITEVKFHYDGDLVFASSKDALISITDLSGEVKGTLSGHSGSINTFSVSGNTLASGAADQTFVIWDVVTGVPISKVSTPSFVRGIDLSNECYFSTDGAFGGGAFIGVHDTRSSEYETLFTPKNYASKIFKHDNYIVIADEHGNISKIDIRNKSECMSKKIHQSKISGLKPSICKSFFISSSIDSTAKIVDFDSFEVKKEFSAEDPINCAAIFATNDKIVLASGVNKRDVTTTRGKSSFDTDFYDIITEEKIGYYTTHFGAINAVDVHPSCSCYASGGEEGILNIVNFGDSFNSAPFTKF